MERSEGGFGRRSFAPIKEGDELDVTIENVGEKGDGLTKVNGFVIFVPGTKQGDKVKIKITKVLRKVGFGEVLGASSASSEEVAPEETSSGETTQETSEENEQGEDSEAVESEAEENSTEENTESEDDSSDKSSEDEE